MFISYVLSLLMKQYPVVRFNVVDHIGLAGLFSGLGLRVEVCQDVLLEQVSLPS